MVYLFVGIGGVIGSLLRYLAGNLFVNLWGKGFPIGTLLINLTGAFFLAWVTSRCNHLKQNHPNLFTGISSGIIGSYTTFSTLSVETVKLLETEEYVLAFLYIVCSLFGGLLLVRLGSILGNKQSNIVGEGKL